MGCGGNSKHFDPEKARFLTIMNNDVYIYVKMIIKYNLGYN